MAQLKDLLVQGPARVIGTTTSNGYRHSSVNDDSYVLKAGGGYKLESNLSVGYASNASYATYSSNATNADCFNSVDNRSFYPGDIVSGGKGRLAFMYAPYLGISGYGEYYDTLILRSYTDSSGGWDNAIMFDKNGDDVWHTRFEYGSTSSWGTPILFIDTNNWSSHIGTSSNPVGYTNSAGNADTVDNEHAAAFAHRQALNNLITMGDEFDFASPSFSGELWINYRTASGGLDGSITTYKMCNGAGGYASVTASGFVKGDSSDSYVLLGGGGHKTEASLSVATAAQLTTPRTIWGQSFDGTSNITGNMSVRGTIFTNRYNASGNVGGADIIINKGSDFFGLGASSAHSVSYFSFGSVSSAGTWISEMLTITDNGKVGIGTTNPSYKLDVNGSLNATTIYQNGVALGSRAFDSTNYLPLSGGAMTGNITFGSNVQIIDESSGYTLFGYAGEINYLGIPYGTTYVRSGDDNLYHFRAGSYYIIWDSANFTPSNYLPVAQVFEAQNSDDNPTWGMTYAESHRQSMVYNTSGEEWAYWIGMRSSDVSYGTILRLSHTGKVQYAHKAGGAAGENWSSWKSIITSDNIGSQSVSHANSAGNADTVDSCHASDFFKYNGWWNDSGGSANYSVDDAVGMVFAYNQHGVPSNWGIVATFDYEYNSSYRLQIFGNGWTNNLYYRNRSADFGGWHPWRTIIDDGNISSYAITSHQSVVNGGNTASWGSSVTVGTVGGTALTFTMPSNPDTWRPITDSYSSTSQSTSLSQYGGYLLNQAKMGKLTVVNQSAPSGLSILDTDDLKYYVFSGTVNALDFTLPVIAESTGTMQHEVMLYFTTGASPNINVIGHSSGGVVNDIKFYSNFKIEANKTYEIHALFNGAAWILACAEVVSTMP